MTSPKTRLHVESDLERDNPVSLSPAHAHFLANVLRLGKNDRVSLFNGRDGEWSCRIEMLGRKSATVHPDERIREHMPEPGPWLFLLFGVGAIVMRGAGCTLNDIADRDFDRKVARTATRPIASGTVKIQQGWLFFGFQLLLGLMVLIQLNTPTIYLGFASLVLVASYPFMKRITYWPQAVLGLAFNWGALMGWSAVHGELAWPAFVLYAGGIFWTLGYDTIYAHQDKEDDVIVGVKSTALKFGEKSKIWLSGFYTVTMVLIAVAGYLTSLAWPFYLVLAIGALHLIWQVRTLNIDDPKNCLRRFKSNRDFGFVILLAIIVGNLFG